jgi:DNA-binding CsgD family transcriptional regulator
LAPAKNPGLSVSAKNVYLVRTKLPLKKHLLLFILCCAGWASLSAQYRQLLHKTYSQRAVLLRDMYQDQLRYADSTTIFNNIQAIKTLATQNADDDLLMEAALLRAHYFYYRDGPPAIVLSILDSLKTEGVERKKIWLEVSAENMMALYNFNHLRQYQLGFEHHHKVYGLIKGLDPAVFPHKQSCLKQMAYEYYFFRDFRESLFYNLEALNTGTPAAFRQYFSELDIMNTTGLCYQQLNMLDSAEYYFRKTISLARENNKAAWEGIASGNLGNNYFLRKQYDEAVPLLQKDVEIAVETKDWGLASGSLMVLGDISLARHDISSAKQYLSGARQYVYRSGQYERLQKLYPLLSKLYGFLGQPSAAAVYLDSALFVRDSVSRKLNALQMLRAKQKVDLEQYRAEVEAIRSQKKINLLERNILISVVVLMMIAAIFIYRGLKKRSARQKEQIRKGREELADAARQLNEFACNISEKNALIEALQQNGGADHALLEQLQQSTILTDHDWEYFRRLFEKVHAGFLTRLKEKVPGLTPAETRFIALSKLDLSNKEMAAMLGIGTDTIRQHRSRLKKKLHLHDEHGIDELVAEI